MSEDFTQKLPKNENDEILTAITKIDNRLQSLEKKVDERLHDIRPIWHKVVADIAELQSGQKRLEDGQKHLEEGQKHLEEGQKRLEEGQQAMRLSMSDLNSTARDVSRDQIVINDVLRRLQRDFHTMDEKLYKLTISRNQQNSST